MPTMLGPTRRSAREHQDHGSNHQERRVCDQSQNCDPYQHRSHMSPPGGSTRASAGLDCACRRSGVRNNDGYGTETEAPAAIEMPPSGVARSTPVTVAALSRQARHRSDRADRALGEALIETLECRALAPQESPALDRIAPLAPAVSEGVHTRIRHTPCWLPMSSTYDPCSSLPATNKVRSLAMS